MKTGFSSSATVTRPANVTAYTAGDVVGAAAAAIEFPLVAPVGGDVIITSADLRIDVAAIPAGMTSFRLALFSGPPPSALADNAAWDLAAADRAVFLGYADLGSPADMGSTLYCQVDGINKQVRLGANSTSLFAYLITNGGFTPGSGDVFALSLRATSL